jgi:hypothetical protein
MCSPCKQHWHPLEQVYVHDGNDIVEIACSSALMHGHQCLIQVNLVTLRYTREKHYLRRQAENRGKGVANSPHDSPIVLEAGPETRLHMGRGHMFGFHGLKTCGSAVAWDFLIEALTWEDRPNS